MSIVVQLEKDITAKQAEAKALLESTMQKAETEGRRMTEDEQKAISAVMADGKALKARLDGIQAKDAMGAEIEKLTSSIGTRQSAPGPRIYKSIGQQFVESDAMRWLKATHGSRGSNWVSPTAELFAATLTTDAASGGDLVISDTRPGIQPLLFKRLTVADLLASGTTDSNLISYMKETTFTNAANTVAEGATKPESTLIFDAVSDPVRKIAHWLPVTEEMLEDVSGIRSYIDARLRLGVELEEEDQLLNGTTVAPDIVGILNRTGLTAAQARGADTNADAIFKQISTISSTIFVQPDGIVLNPANWQTIQLTKNAAGNYLGNGPWAAPQNTTLWGISVAVTPSIAANTGLVGAFKSMAQVFRKGGIRLEASNSHSDFFVKNLVAIRAEERLALAVYRPAAFGTVTGLN